MKLTKRFTLQVCIALFGLLLLGTTAQAAHRAILFNQNAMDKVLEMWPDFEESVNNQARGMEGAGARGILTQSPLRAHLAQLLREQPTPAQYGDGFKKLVNERYLPAGMTAFASRLNTKDQVSAYHYMMREDGRLPIRFAYAADLARQAIPAAAAAGMYENTGAMWETIEYNPWLWLHGMASEGDWDAPNRGCQGDDLPVKPGVDKAHVKEVLEICPDFSTPSVQSLMRGVRSGWRFAGVHAAGSNAIRLFIQKLEGHMKANPKVLTLDYVRNSRHGFAHGTLTGAVPEVVAGMLKYNLYLPINLRRAMAIEPDNCRQNYVEACFDFIGPVKTLLDQGVKVVGEFEQGSPTPETYYDIFDVYVNREVEKEGYQVATAPATFGEGVIYGADEGVDRVVALKLFTYRSAEFLMAETKIGSLEVGKYADFVVTEKPYLSGPDHEIRDNKTIMTVLANEIRYKDPAYNPVHK